MILGLEEGDFGSKNGTRGGMEGGMVEKRADGLGGFSTLSIYVKYPPMPGLPFFSIFGGFSSLFVLPCLPPCLVLSILLVAIFGGACLAMPLHFQFFPIIHSISIIL